MRGLCVRFYALSLSIYTTTSALPPQGSIDTALLLSHNFNSTVNPNATHSPNSPMIASSLSGIRSPTCYRKGHRSPHIDYLTCYAVISTLQNDPRYLVPTKRPLHPGLGGMSFGKQGCQLQIWDGASPDTFSYQDIVETMIDILAVCQDDRPEGGGGTGGQMGVGRRGFVVRVVGYGYVPRGKASKSLRLRALRAWRKRSVRGFR